jgi:hypothetical protein
MFKELWLTYLLISVTCQKPCCFTHCSRLLSTPKIPGSLLHPMYSLYTQRQSRACKVTHEARFSRIEFQLYCLWIRFVSQGVGCFHTVDLGGHSLDSQYAPRFFVDNLHKGNQVLPRLHTKQVISHFFLQLVSQDSAQELFRHTIAPDLGVSRIEF